MERIRDQLGDLEAVYTDSIDLTALVVKHTHFGEAETAQGDGHILFGQVGLCLEMKYK